MASAPKRNLAIVSEQLQQAGQRFEVLRKLRVAVPSTRTMMLLDCAERDLVVEAFRSGALTFSFYRNQPLHCDFSVGQISSDAGLFPLRPFDQRHGLTGSLARQMSDPRQDDRERHSVRSCLRQRIYQIVAGYEDANNADRLRHDPAFQILTDQPLGQALGSQATLTRWENAPADL